MKRPGKKIRKNIMVNPLLVKRARKILSASSDSQAIEMALDEIAQRKTNEEAWEATREFIKKLAGSKVKPLFD